MLFFATYAVAANRNSDPITHTERLTALTVYISIVGLVYQLVLRQIWEPVGLQRVVDELLHSVIPVAVLVFWVVYGREVRLSYSKVPVWMLFPLVYLIVILIRGAFSGFYPYPFIDVAVLGYTIVMRNAFVVMLLFLFLSFLLVFMNRKFAKHP